MDSIVESWEKSLETWEVFMLRPANEIIWTFDNNSCWLFTSSRVLLHFFGHAFPFYVCSTYFVVVNIFPLSDMIHDIFSSPRHDNRQSAVSQWKGKDEDSKGWRGKKLKKINVYRIVVGQWRRHKSQRNDETVMVSEMKNEDTMRLSAFYRCMFPQLADL